MLKNIIANDIFLLVSRLVLGFVFIYAGIVKIANPDSFAIDIMNYKLFPIFLVNIIAIFIPWLEVVTGLLLIFGVSVKENAFIINVLLMIFILLIVIALFRGLDITCGCFGVQNSTSVGLGKILENIVLLALGVQLLVFDSKLFSLAKSEY